MAPITMSARRLSALGLAASLGAASCGGAVVSSRIEDKARRDVPIAICRKPLAPSDTIESGAPRPEAYWSVLFPGFHGFSSALDSTSRDCVGDAVLAADKGASPVALSVSPADATIVPGEDGLEAVWLRAAALPDRTSPGVLALVRPRPAELDVYAVGAYRGSAHASALEFARIGDTTFLLLRDNACADVAAGAACESTVSVYLNGGGLLTPAAKVTTERIQYGTMKDIGRIKWRMTTAAPLFDAKSMHVRETLSLLDSREDEVRKSEGERIYTLHGGELVPNVDSIWSRVERVP